MACSGFPPNAESENASVPHVLHVYFFPRHMHSVLYKRTSFVLKPLFHFGPPMFSFLRYACINANGDVHVMQFCACVYGPVEGLVGSKPGEGSLKLQAQGDVTGAR